MADCEGKKQQEMKRLFEGEYSAVLVGDNENWLWDEDEEFQFDVEGGNKWFEDAFEKGLAECALMRGVQRSSEENLKLMDEYSEKVKEEENEAFEKLRVKMEADERNKENKQTIEKDKKQH